MRKLFLIGLFSLISCSAIKSHRTSYYQQAGSFEQDQSDLNLNQPSNTSYCASYEVKATTAKQPVDIIFVIDNSGSMTNKIAAVVENINIHFAQIIEQSGLDYRVIMLTKHGPNPLDVCIEAPLSTIPVGGCQTIYSNPPGINPGKFYHYSIDVESNDSLCLILNSLTGKQADNFQLAPNGFIQWLRPEAEKVFIEITDDLPMCSFTTTDFYEKYVDQDLVQAKNDALVFDKTLLSLAPEQFGTENDRKYKFYSIIGMQAKNLLIDPDNGYFVYPNSSAYDPFQTQDMVVQDLCVTGQAAGLTYQYLSLLTNALRFPICYPKGFSSIFNDVAAGIINGNQDICHLQVPTSTQLNIDAKTSIVEYYYNNVLKQTFTPLLKNENCVSVKNKFQLDEQLGTIELCKDSCNQVILDSKSKLVVAVDCNGKIY